MRGLWGDRCVEMHSAHGAGVHGLVYLPWLRALHAQQLPRTINCHAYTVGHLGWVGGGRTGKAGPGIRVDI